MNLLKPLAAAVLALSAFGASAAPVYDVAADFSVTNNPSGVWTYGETNGFGGAFTKFTDSGTTSTIDFWRGANPAFGTPVLYHNNSVTPFTSGSVSYGPFEAGFHPGVGDRDTTYRFTAPTSGLYAFNGRFFGQDTVGTTTEVRLFVNSLQQGAPIDVTGFGAPSTQLRASTFTLAAGDFLDISVGNRGSVFNDSTGLAVTISAVPEPQTVGLMLAGLAMVGVAGKRRKA